MTIIFSLDLDALLICALSIVGGPGARRQSLTLSGGESNRRLRKIELHATNLNLSDADAYARDTASHFLEISGY
jgi:hypothetical protein